jgi:hypothetical protein
MGGSGSGGWYRWDTKPTTENFWRSSIKNLKDHKLFNEPICRSGTWTWSTNGQERSNIGYEINTRDEYSHYMRVYYTNTRTQEKQDYKIRLSTTSPNYGGKRWWFHCPAAGCGKRVGVLYLANIFACRHCYNLSYSSQNQAPHDRYTDKAFALAQKLGHDGNVIDGFYGRKPKGMHWKTYERKKAILDHYTDKGMALAGIRFKGLFNW